MKLGAEVKKREFFDAFALPRVISVCRLDPLWHARISVCLFRMSSHSFSACQTPGFFSFFLICAEKSLHGEVFRRVREECVRTAAHRTALG